MQGPVRHGNVHTHDKIKKNITKPPSPPKKKEKEKNIFVKGLFDFGND
jgi:hypothetical protein